MATQIFRDVVGMNFVVSVKTTIDLTSYTATIRFLRGDSSTITRTAIVDAAAKRVNYVTVSGDINSVGNWKLQVIITNGTNTYSSTIIPFTVVANL